MLSFSEFCEQPVDFCRFEGHIDLDSRRTGNGSRDAGATGLFVLHLCRFLRLAQQFIENELEFAAFEAYGGGFYGQSAGAEGFGFEAVAFELLRDGGEADHLRGEELDQDRRKEALALDLLDLPFAEDLFEEDALVGYVLIDDPEAFFVGGEDEGVAELAEGF